MESLGLEPPFRVGMHVNVPSSMRHLPDPHFPSQKQFEKADAVRRSIIEKSGIRPGIYTTIDDDLYHRVEFVYNELIQILLKELSKLNTFDTCKRFYVRHETFYGHAENIRYRSVPDTMLGNPTPHSIQQRNLWYLLSPFTEATRWLIELGVKHCSASGVKAGGALLDHLLVLACVLYEWDGVWEYIAYDMVPHQVVVKPDYTLLVETTPRGVTIRDAYDRASVPYRNEARRDWAGTTLPSHKQVTMEDAMATPLAKALDQPLKAERGYSMEDLLNFSCGLIDSFGETEYIKVANMQKLSVFLSDKWSIHSRSLEGLLNDYGLSQEVVVDLSADMLRPVEHARRDSRLLRRPIVLLKHNGNLLCLYGVETCTAWFRMFPFRLGVGQIRFPGMVDTGPLRKAIGEIQRTLGDPLRDGIEDQCKAAGFESMPEKDKVRNESIPQGSGFGPIDVLVIDRQHRRFVLVEAKNTSGDEMVPRLIKQEFDTYRGYIETLHKQTGWFRDRVEGLKTEYGIPDREEYTVEGVIVVNAPRVWMYAHSEPLPVVDEKAFYRLLKQGDRLVTTPVPFDA